MLSATHKESQEVKNKFCVMPRFCTTFHMRLTVAFGTRQLTNKFTNKFYGLGLDVHAALEPPLEEGVVVMAIRSQ